MTHGQTYGYLPRQVASPPYDRYQIVQFGDRDTVQWGQSLRRRHEFSTTVLSILYLYQHTHLTALCPGLPGWAGTRKVKPIWILLKQETVSGSGISWAICKSAPCSRQITMPAPHHSVFYRPDALPATQPTVSKHCTKAESSN